MAKAAKGGKWLPRGDSSGRLTLAQLEGFLCLPTPLFFALRRLLLPIRPNLPSAMQVCSIALSSEAVSSPCVVTLSFGRPQLDLHDGLETTISFTLEQVQTVGAAYHSPMPVTTKVIELVGEIAKKKEGVKAISGEELFR
jgi:hypothetical protein